MPSTFPRSLMIPAMLFAEPFGLAAAVTSPDSVEYLKTTLPSDSSPAITCGSAWKLPSPWEMGRRRVCPETGLACEDRLRVLDSQVRPDTPEFQVLVTHKYPW